MNAHEFVTAVARALKDCSAHGFGGGNAAKERSEYLALGAQIRHHLHQTGYTEIEVESVGPYVTIRTDDNRWILHLGLEAEGKG